MSLPALSLHSENLALRTKVQVLETKLAQSVNLFDKLLKRYEAKVEEYNNLQAASAELAKESRLLLEAYRGLTS